MSDEIPKLQKMYYTPNEPFDFLVQFIAEETNRYVYVQSGYFLIERA